MLPLRVPPLRERVGDVALLAATFLEQSCRANERRLKTLSAGAQRLLEGYGFPGNVRELRNLVERLVILSPGDEITEADAKALLPIAGGVPGGVAYRPGTPLREMVEECERSLILASLEHHGGHITNTAADLSLERSHLYKKMKSLGIKRGES